jgi:hypothetical protein
MPEVEKADASVDAASCRVQGLDRFSRSAPVGKAELVTIVLEGLAVVEDEDLARRAPEAIVYQLYCEIVERAAILVERSEAARERLWPLVWTVAALIPPSDTSLRGRVPAAENSLDE